MPTSPLHVRIQKRVSQQKKDTKNKETKPLAGLGLKRLRADQAAIRTLSLTHSYLPRYGIRAQMPHRVVSANAVAPTEYEPAIVAVPAHLRRADTTVRPPAPLAQAGRVLAMTAAPTTSGAGSAGATMPSATAGSMAATSSPPDPFKTLVGNAAQILVMRAVPAAGALGLAQTPVPEKDIYNFNSYIYLRKPELMELPDQPSGLLAEFLAEARRAIRNAVYAYVKRFIHLYEWIPQGSTSNHPEEWALPISTAQLDDLVEILYGLFLEWMGVDLYEVYVRVSKSAARADLIVTFHDWLRFLLEDTDWEEGGGHSSADAQAWRFGPQQVLDLFRATHAEAFLISDIPDYRGYGFFPFYDEVNFGLQLVYRQEWLRLGNQAGAIVKTIPLGPKQSEKVTVTIERASTLRRTTDTTQETETTRESTTAEKDSSEVVKENATSLKWHVDAEASYNYGSGSASLSAGVAGDSSSRSQDTKSRINESTDRTASRMRRETKISVSTERSEKDALSTVSEITNPNEEIAVTYVYSRMSRQYEISTFLAEVNSVVFVPERLWPPDEITADWIRRYSWILARVLLDESFRADLSSIVNDVDEQPLSASEMGDFQAIAAEAKKMSTFSALPGRIPEMFKGATDAYEKQIDKNRSIAAKTMRTSRRELRLIQHIQDNILHYARAIWDAEDPQQRMQRYATIQVPTEWIFVPDSGAGTTGMTAAWPGEFVPVEGSERSVADVINPAGPIGYVVNYAIFYLRSDATTVNLNRALLALRSLYTRSAVTVTAPSNAPTPLDAFVLAPRWQEASYSVAFAAAGAKPTVTNTTPHVTYTLDPAAVTIAGSGTRVEFEGLHLFFENAPSNATYTITARLTGELLDPEEPVLHLNLPLPIATDEPAFFQPQLAEMARLLPELPPPPQDGQWTSLQPAAQEQYRRAYHRFVLIKQHTRTILLETGNVMLDLEVGQTPALEDFKRLHRAVDVAKALEEYDKGRLDNVRRDRRIVDDNDYSDPDIERVTVVGPASALASAVGVNLTNADDGDDA